MHAAFKSEVKIVFLINLCDFNYIWQLNGGAGDRELSKKKEAYGGYVLDIEISSNFW